MFQAKRIKTHVTASVKPGKQQDCFLIQIRSRPGFLGIQSSRNLPAELLKTRQSYLGSAQIAVAGLQVVSEADQYRALLTLVLVIFVSDGWRKPAELRPK